MTKQECFDKMIAARKTHAAECERLAKYVALFGADSEVTENQQGIVDGARHEVILWSTYARMDSKARAAHTRNLSK